MKENLLPRAEKKNAAEEVTTFHPRISVSIDPSKATTQTNSKEKKATMADKVDVLKKVAERIEFFFSDANFRKDE